MDQEAIRKKALLTKRLSEGGSERELKSGLVF